MAQHSQLRVCSYLLALLNASSATVHLLILGAFEHGVSNVLCCLFKLRDWCRVKLHFLLLSSQQLCMEQLSSCAYLCTHVLVFDVLTITAALRMLGSQWLIRCSKSLYWRVC
jgi:hypothetical protein